MEKRRQTSVVLKKFSSILVFLIVGVIAILGYYLSTWLGDQNTDKYYPQKVKEATMLLDDSIELLSSTEIKPEIIKRGHFLIYEKGNIQATMSSLNVVIYCADSSLLPRSNQNYSFKEVKELHDKNIAELKQVKNNLKEIETHLTNLESFIRLNPDKTDQIKESMSLTNEAIKVNLKKLREVNRSFKTAHHLELDVKTNAENLLKDSSQAIKKQTLSTSP